MKKLTLKVATSIALLTAGFASAHAEDYSKIDVKKECDLKANEIEKVIASAKKYNDVAKKKALEFRRLDINNTDLIISVEEAIKSGAKEVNPKDFKGKESKTKLPTDVAAIRACKFAISALTQETEAKTTWRLAVPGDGYKY